MTDDKDIEAARSLLDVSRETFLRLEAFVALLRRWQKAVQLVAPSTLPHLWTRHIADSAQAATAAPAARRWIDLGAGGGFPGIVLAIVLRDIPESHVDLIESDSRKAAFLRSAVRELDLKAGVHAARIEDALDDLPPADAITARALAPLPRLLSWAGRRIDSGAAGVFFKGQNLQRELTDESLCRRFSLTLIPSRTDPDARLVLAKALHDPARPL